MNILGINAYHGDASAVILCEGELVAAVEEERFNRIKHSAGFPYEAVCYCVKEARLKAEEIDHIAVSRNPRAHIYKKILHAFYRRPSFQFLRSRLIQASKIRDIRREVGKSLDVDPERLGAQIHNVEHHRAHMASSFFVSGFEDAAILSVDGFGDFVSTMWGVGRDGRIEVTGWVEFPYSLGILYTAFTQYLGFPKYGDEYKVMGLASYGDPWYLAQFQQIIHLEDDAGFRLDLSYFVHHSQGVFMTWDEGAPVLENLYSKKMVERFGPARERGAKIERRHQDLAASLQALLEEAIFDMLNKLYQKTRIKKLCLGGGVALNCVVNGKILEMTPFEEVYIQPAAHDGGTSLGAAFYVYHHVLGRGRNFKMGHVYWGPEWDNEKVKGVLDSYGLSYRFYENDKLVSLVATHLAEGKIVGWYQGRMEFGPRALGNRSIVVDPRKAEMKEVLNGRIKHREPFRPFAPSILKKAVGDYFESGHPSPFMLMTYKVREDKRHQIPAVTHVDGTGRLQSVDKETNSLYWQLIREFEKLTGVPVLLNTSFNENEPIVCSPQEAIDCFLRTKMDILVIGNYVVVKEEGK